MTSTPDLLSVALSYHQGGDLQTAERLYRQLSAANESHAEAAYLLGSLYQSQNRPAEAEEWLRRATELRADYPEALNNPGVVLVRTEEEYVVLAAQAAAAPEHLATLRAGLRSKMQNSPLCAGRSFTRNLERVYRDMWRKGCEAQRFGF